MNNIDLMKYWFERAIKKDILDNINKGSLSIVGVKIL